MHDAIATSVRDFGEDKPQWKPASPSELPPSDLASRFRSESLPQVRRNLIVAAFRRTVDDLAIRDPEEAVACVLAALQPKPVGKRRSGRVH
jgi:hypothetical protein